MSTQRFPQLRRILAAFLCLIAVVLFAPLARAGITFKLEFSQGSDDFGNHFFRFNPWSTTTNSTSPAAPLAII